MKKTIMMIGMMGIVFLLMAQVVQAADDYKPFGVRLRAIYVKPYETFDGRLAPYDLTIGNNIIPEVDFEYFFIKNFSAELVAAFTKHDIKAGNDIMGSTWLLPPTLTVKYHPLAGSTVSPYIGVGGNLTIPFNSQLNGVNDFSIDNTIGWVAQAGADIRIKGDLYFNVDYKYVSVNTNVKVAGTKYKLDLNPSLFGVGVGYRF